MKLIAIRHGETEWNVAGREIGQLDSALTDRGRRQAAAIAQRIATMKVDAIYASDLGRAMRTAEIIGAACGVAVTPDAELRERHMGIFQGLTVDERRERYPADQQRFESLDPDYVIPQGESARQRNARSLRAFTAIAARHPSATVVGVTHSGLLRGFSNPSWASSITTARASAATTPPTMNLPTPTAGG